MRAHWLGAKGHHGRSRGADHRSHRRAYAATTLAPATSRPCGCTRAGFPPTTEHPDGDHSTWGCSWYNPTGNTPQAIATAVCLLA